MTLKGFALLYIIHYIIVKLEKLKLKLHHHELGWKIQNNFELFPKSISFWIRMIRPFYHTINHFWPCWTIFDQAWKTDKQNMSDLSDRYIEWGQFKNQTKFRYFVSLFTPDHMRPTLSINMLLVWIFMVFNFKYLNDSLNYLILSITQVWY